MSRDEDCKGMHSRDPLQGKEHFHMQLKTQQGTQTGFSHTGNPVPHSSSTDWPGTRVPGLYKMHRITRNRHRVPRCPPAQTPGVRMSPGQDVLMRL